MFSSDIVSQDCFLDMPGDGQLLYFHLGINSDDEGFVSPKRIMRMIGASEDSLKILIAKGFIIPFESGVVVITHWRQNNYLQKDRLTPTLYQKEVQTLKCIQNVYIPYTQYSIGKYSIDKKGEVPSEVEEIRKDLNAKFKIK